MLIITIKFNDQIHCAFPSPREHPRHSLRPRSQVQSGNPRSRRLHQIPQERRPSQGALHGIKFNKRENY